MIKLTTKIGGMKIAPSLRSYYYCDEDFDVEIEVKAKDASEAQYIASHIVVDEMDKVYDPSLLVEVFYS